MDRKRIERILEQVGRGNMTVDAAMEQLRLAPLEKLGFATIDLHRATRRGFPEVIYGPGKTTEEIVEIARRMHAAGQNVLITRVDPDVHSALAKIATGAVHHPLARAVTLAASTSGKDKADKPRPGITVMTAGTSDRPVAEEAAVTAETMGNEVQRIFDVGVAGIHRLFEHQEAMVRSRVIVVVAGMEGALPSIVATS